MVLLLTNRNVPTVMTKITMIILCTYCYYLYYLYAQIDKDLTQTEAEITAFQLEKQRKLNELVRNRLLFQLITVEIAHFF
jgi:Ca2+/Na+ antiporter